MRHAVILAGGSGTRLWPLSRRRRPKQFLRLFDGASLLKLARQRLTGLFPPQCIWITTAAEYLDQVAAELPDIPPENLLGEPVGRDTANAIGLAANLLKRRDPDATMAVFTADHLISPQESFAAAIRTGLDAADRYADHLVTFGIQPDCPHTGYGYIRRGERVSNGLYRVREFKEKPSLEVAESYLRAGEYLWNSGMFAWPVDTILRELERHLPENAARLSDVAAAWPQPASAAKFRALTKVSIDYSVMEKADRVLVVEMACHWLDLGSWSAVAGTRPADAVGNVTIAPQALTLDSGNNILVSEADHLLVALGVNDLIVVHSPDVTLVCHRAHEQEIRRLADLRQKRYGDRYE